MCTSRALLLGVAAAALLPTASAGAASVSYIDGGEVWRASLDGARKQQLSTGQGGFNVLAAADGGVTLGVQRQATTSSLSFTTFWNPDGSLLRNGALWAETGWTTYVHPLGLDLTASGGVVVYGFSNSRPSGQLPPAPFFQFSRGHTVLPAANAVASSALPIYKRDPENSSVFQDRVVGVVSDKTVVMQKPGTGPASEESDFVPWFAPGMPAGYELDRADVAATGSVVAWERSLWSQGKRLDARIDIAPLPGGVGAAPDYAKGCTIPAQGQATNVSISQDGTRVAWKDDGGVKVAGIPDFSGADDCVFTAPVLVISPTGSEPSIGGADVPAAASPSVPAATTPPKPTPTPTSAAPVVTPPAPPRAVALVRGLPVTVRVTGPGKVVVTLTVGGVVVARGQATATTAGTLKVRLKATKAGRRQLKRLKGKKGKLKVTVGATSTTITVKLR